MKKKILIALGIVAVFFLIKLCFLDKEICKTVKITQNIVVSIDDEVVLITEAWVGVKENGKTVLAYSNSVKVTEDNIINLRSKELKKAEEAISKQGCM